MEEVGFDMKDRAYDDQYLERDLNGQLIRLYIVKQVPLDTKFAAKTKNEIKVIFLWNKFLLFYFSSSSF
jgi:mRNA-decapping enzyme subunit 2